MIQSALRSKVKESIPARHEVSLQSAKEILNYQVALLKSKVDYFKSLFSGLEKTQENLQLVPMILALALIESLVLFGFGIAFLILQKAA